MAKFHKGRYKPKHPEKYVGDVNNIVYRSSWELSFCRWIDNNPAVKKFNMEGVVIPYVSVVDNKVHRYFVDFILEFEDRKGEIRRALVEVKPHKQTQPPVAPKKKSKYYINEVLTYHVNMSKWKAAIEFCKKNNMDFVILTEKGAINLTKGAASEEMLLENLEGFKCH